MGAFVGSASKKEGQDRVKIYIQVEGYMVQNVFASTPDVDVVVVDYDVPEEERQNADPPAYHVY